MYCLVLLCKTMHCLELFWKYHVLFYIVLEVPCTVLYCSGSTMYCLGFFFTTTFMFQILSYLQRDKRLGEPKNCPDWLNEIMLSCWEHNTQDRAKSQDIVQCIHEHIHE